MKKKIIAAVSLLIILSFIGYIVYDTAVSRKEDIKNEPAAPVTSYPENWKVNKVLPFNGDTLIAVAVADNGDVIAGGESFVSVYDSLLSWKWGSKTDERITSVTASGDTIFASSASLVYLFNSAGKKIDEWGPYEANSIITSISASRRFLSVADAGNKMVYIVKKNGEVAAMIGQGEHKFIVPSPYFDVAMNGDDTLYIAHTGTHKIEKWTTGGVFISDFGKAGSAPEEFTACCNPSHFALIPTGFVTAEKGLNRIKILDRHGNFMEFVSVNNNFSRPHPLDVASYKGRIIYAANEFDSKLYVFIRK